MRIQYAVLGLAALALPGCAADYSLELRPENTKIQWSLGGALHAVHGTFNLKRGRIDFGTDSGKASGQVVVDVANGNSGNESRDHKMHGSVLESAKYPEAIFTPSQIDGALAVPGTSHVKVSGKFTIHGATHELSMDVQATATADQIRTTIAFDIPYVTWGMKDPSNFLLKVDKTVHVSIEAAGPLQKR